MPGRSGDAIPACIPRRAVDVARGRAVAGVARCAEEIRLDVRTSDGCFLRIARAASRGRRVARSPRSRDGVVDASRHAPEQRECAMTDALQVIDSRCNAD
jgi:hypothetical protein